VLDRRSDEQLARAAGRGDVAAFEVLYDRHHLQLLSFSRHMLGRVHDAEDVVQHTFIAADGAFRSGKVHASVRAWLYTVARNRCISVLRARREEHELPDAGVPSTENLAGYVEQRADLRELLADLRTLPEDQRAALLLSELGDLSHAEVAAVIGVRSRKVKALVFQAREHLMAVAEARLIPCHSIREELAVATGAGLRRRHLRNHLADCDDCSAYASRVRAQRASVAAILPVIPTVALRDSVLGALGTGGVAAAGAGGAGAGLGALAAKSTAAKVLAIAAIGGTAAGGGTAAVRALDDSRPHRPARSAQHHVRTAPTPMAKALPAPSAAVPSVRTSERARAVERASARDAPSERRKAADAPDTTPASSTSPGRGRGDGKPADQPATPRGRALGHAKQQARGNTPPGQVKRAATGKPTPPGQAKKQAAPQPKAKPAKPPAAPALVPPASAPLVPPGQADKDAKPAKDEQDQAAAAAGG
jgi:RNA polymerase sigma factor (sigma-70 family)